MDAQQLIRDTLEELEVKAIRPLRYLVAVRSLPIEERTASGLWLPPKATSFYGELPHLKQLQGIVLAVGPKTPGLRPGALVGFQRLHFSRWCGMKDGTFVGWIDYNDLHGTLEAEDGIGNGQDVKCAAGGNGS